jgi:hypothetical protein
MPMSDIHDLICAECNRNYGQHYGELCDWQDKSRVFALKSPKATKAVFPGNRAAIKFAYQLLGFVEHAMGEQGVNLSLGHEKVLTPEESDAIPSELVMARLNIRDTRQLINNWLMTEPK